MDKRIGEGFLRAGVGYGGSCFPKDTKALNEICHRNGINFELLQGVINVNNKQRMIAINKLKTRLGELRGKRIAVLGLAFKPNTDDVRESPALEIIKVLLEEGALVSAFDPMAMQNAAGQLTGDVKYCESPLEAVRDASAVMVITDWKEFIDLDWQAAKKTMKEPFVVIDGRNCLDQDQLKNSGFAYEGFGRKGYSA